MNPTLITQLQNPKHYDHRVTRVTVMETHISWILLAGAYAYKIKKAVNYGFLDFSSLEKRHHYCEEELRLNQRLAPDLYQAVIPIRGTPEHPQLNGEGPIIEYAVKMHAFQQKQLFSQLLKKNHLLPIHIIELAKTIARFHQSAAHVPANLPFGTPEQIQEPVQQNFDQIAELLTDESDFAQLTRIRTWANEQYHKLLPVFAARRADGFIRECHGDIHLGNIILHAMEQPLLFDCIEFNDAFRWTDVMADVAFIVMDLQDHQRYPYAQTLLNTYLEQTGDYAGLAVLPYYQSYRAVVRAKVALFRLSDPTLSSQEQTHARQHYRRSMSLAERYLTPPAPALLITQGFSGSGKSSVARRLVEQLGCIQIRSDIERKRLHGFASDAQTHSELNDHIYAPDNTEKTYKHLAKLATLILNADYAVVVDATFLKIAQRTLFKQLAASRQIPFIILHCEAPLSTLKTILDKRQARQHHVSEATHEVLDMQQTTVEAFSEQEQGHVITLDTTLGREGYYEVIDEIQNRLKYFQRIE